MYWWKNIVIYEVYVDKFAGTFFGLTQKIEYLKSLGIKCIHVLPHYPSPMIDDGYDVIDYMNVRDNLGTLDDFKHFVIKAHQAGIKVIIDFVLNHTSTRHPWFVLARNSRQNSKRDFYLWSREGKEYAMAPNLFPDLKPKNWIFNAKTNDYYFSTFHQEQADLNWNNPRVFFEMMRVLDFWVAMGVDGFRLDAASHLVKKDGTVCDGLPETHVIIKKIRSHLDKNYQSRIVLLAEVCDSIENTKKYFGNGDECHLLYNFPLVGQLLLALKRKNKKIVQQFSKKMANITENCDWVNFLSHHDEKSLTVVTKKEQDELFAYFDPNKKYRFSNGFSLRIAHLSGNKKKKIIEVLRLLLSVPGSTILYYGDEIGMKNDLLLPQEKDTRKSLRGTFDWELANRYMSDKYSLLTRISGIIKNRNMSKKNITKTQRFSAAHLMGKI